MHAVTSMIEIKCKYFDRICNQLVSVYESNRETS